VPETLRLGEIGRSYTPWSMPNRLRRRQENASADRSTQTGLTVESLLAAVVESSDDAIITKDMSGKITSWNPAAEAMYGYTAKEALGRPITIIVPEEHASDVWMILRSIAAGERVRHHETVRSRKDGTLIDVSLTVSPVVDSGGRVIAASVIARDISERVRAERAVRASHRALQALLMDMPLYGVILSATERIEFCNRALAALVGSEPIDLVGQQWDEVFGVYPEDKEAWTLFAEGYVTPHYEGRVRDAAGVERDVFWSNVAYGESDQSELLLASVGQDVTASKAAADELARAVDDREQLIEAVLAAEFDERARLAEALHDDTIQALTATLIQLDMAIAERPDDTTVIRARETLSNALGRVRGLMFELRPRVLDEAGLPAAVRVLAEDASRDGGFEVAVDVLAGRFARPVEELAYRTVREAVINCARHSRATRVRISIAKAEGELMGVVQDDGVGFDMERVQSRAGAKLHIGLAAMAERVRLARGTVEVASRPGEGTTVRFSIPTGPSLGSQE
jgi:PAS domain S-box-containing protein